MNPAFFKHYHDEKSTFDFTHINANPTDFRLFCAFLFCLNQIHSAITLK